METLLLSGLNDPAVSSSFSLMGMGARGTSEEGFFAPGTNDPSPGLSVSLVGGVYPNEVYTPCIRANLTSGSVSPFRIVFNSVWKSALLVFSACASRTSLEFSDLALATLVIASAVFPANSAPTKCWVKGSFINSIISCCSVPRGCTLLDILVIRFSITTRIFSSAIAVI